MAQKLETPCSNSTCPELTTKRYCEKHYREAKKRWRNRGDYDGQRASSAQRGYDSKWQKVRDRYIKKHPLCERCDSRGHTKPATLVHHIVPLPEGRRLDPENLKSLCYACHDIIHEQMDESEKRVQLVCGPPASGKSTFVKKNMRPGDLVVDVDLLFQALGRTPPYQKPSDLLDPVLRTRDFLLGYIAETPDLNTCWVVAGAPERKERQRLKQKLGAEVNLLLVDKSTSRQRIGASEIRQDTDRHLSNLEDWWERYEPSEDDDRIYENHGVEEAA